MTPKFKTFKGPLIMQNFLTFAKESIHIRVAFVKNVKKADFKNQPTLLSKSALKSDGKH
jgi:hypothetical protein